MDDALVADGVLAESKFEAVADGDVADATTLGDHDPDSVIAPEWSDDTIEPVLGCRCRSTTTRW
ncbi:hypothetical protein [Streptomyces sp. NPDC002845]